MAPSSNNEHAGNPITQKAIPRFLKEMHAHVYSKTCIRMLTVVLSLTEMTGIQNKRRMDRKNMVYSHTELFYDNAN